MSKSPFTVFIVEDEAPVLQLLGETLCDDFTVELFASAEACLERLQTAKPDLLLLDIRLPGVDGTTFCSQLKDDFDTGNIPVTIISGLDSIDMRLSAYNAGAQDFIAKPFKPAEVVRKIQVSQRTIAEKRKLSEQAGFAQRTAFSVMTGMSELGVVMQFFSRSFGCATGDEIAEAILDSLKQYDLQGALQFRLRDETHTVSPEGVDLPLEASIFDSLRTRGRIFELKNRCVFNFPRISILIKNMPLNDPERCGRIRDNSAILAEGADARLAAIEVEQANRRQREGAQRALKQVREAIDISRASNRQDRMRSTELMHDLLVALEDSFMSLGLTEVQEAHLQQLVKGYAQLLINIQERDSTTEQQLEVVAMVLGNLTK